MNLNLSQKRNLITALICIAFAVVAAFLLLAKREDQQLRKAAEIEKASALPLPAPAEIAQAYGGLSTNAEQQALVGRVGAQLVSGGDVTKLDREFRFYLLADQTRHNVFSLPDGSIFITTLLLNHLKTEGQLAALLAREVAHVAARHTPRFEVTAILSFTPAQTVGAEVLAVHYMTQAGYDPRVLTETLVMLDGIHARTPIEFFATHPTDGGHSDRLNKVINKELPNGVPETMSK